MGEELGENWPAIYLKYETDALMYSLTASQTLEFAAVILSGDALQFYDEKVRGEESTYEEFKRLISARFNNRSMQERVKTYLQGLRFEQFAKDGVSLNDALIKLVSVIKKNYSKTPQSWRYEDSKLEVLENSVSGMPWARSPIYRLQVDLK